MNNAFANNHADNIIEFNYGKNDMFWLIQKKGFDISLMKVKILNWVYILKIKILVKNNWTHI